MAKNYKLLYNYFMGKIEDIHKYIWIEFCIWFFIICIAVTGIKIHNHNEAKKLVSYQIFLPDVDGLIVGSPVRYMGVEVGYIEKVRIVSGEVYLKFVVTDKDLQLPKGVIATVEFNGMGGSKSLELYPPSPMSKAEGKLIAIQKPVRLNDATSLLGDMYNKINSIIVRTSYFAKEVGVVDIKEGINTEAIEENMNTADLIMKKFEKGEFNGKGELDGESENN